MASGAVLLPLVLAVQDDHPTRTVIFDRLEQGQTAIFRAKICLTDKVDVWFCPQSSNRLPSPAHGAGFGEDILVLVGAGDGAAVDVAVGPDQAFGFVDLDGAARGTG